MKAKEITMQIVKNLGNYEAVRLEATFTVLENEDLTQCFCDAKQKLQNAFQKAYNKKETLTLTHPRFNGICSALLNAKTDIKEIEKYFVISDEVKQYFLKHDLI